MEQNQLYCQYIGDVCSRSIEEPKKDGLFFAYPSKPEVSAEAIQSAIKLIAKNVNLDIGLINWQDLPIEGNIIFCEICEAIRKSTCVVLNTTYVNFNIMFEYGYAIGANKAIWPIVEEGISKEDRIYTSIETITTIGYSTFKNSKHVYEKMLKKEPWRRRSKFDIPQSLDKNPTREAVNLLYLKSLYEDEASLRITEALASMPIYKIVDNPREVPFQPLQWYLNNLKKSYVVVINLGSNRVVGYSLHWAKCALIAGIALSMGRRLLILGEDVAFKPIDYQDLIRSYKSAQQAGKITEGFLDTIRIIIFDFQKSMQYEIAPPKSLESKDSVFRVLDLGDYSAENEEMTLRDYFVETPQFIMALKPEFKVFIGRRGTGKTANFFMILDRLKEDKRNIVCNIKPEAWQLDELAHFIKNELNIAKKGYLLQSLWKYMLYSELLKFCHDIIQKKPIYTKLSVSENAIKTYVEDRRDIYDLSFTSRLIATVRYICSHFNKGATAEIAVSEIIHEKEIIYMNQLLVEFTRENQGKCTLVIDSLDANWEVGEDYKIKADIILSLIESAKDMWRMCTRDLKKIGIGKCISILIFLRSDIFEVILQVAKEPDKLQYELIYWNNINQLLEIVNKRISSSLSEYGIESLNWNEILEPGFTPENMKSYLDHNILRRPRDIIFFLQRCFYNAQARGMGYLAEQDFKNAIIEYSEYAFKSHCTESQPFIPSMENLLFEFAGGPSVLTLDSCVDRLRKAGVRKRDIRATINFLIRSNFLGFMIEDSIYNYPVTPTEIQLVMQKVWKRKRVIDKPRTFEIHNAFRHALLLN